MTTPDEIYPNMLHQLRWKILHWQQTDTVSDLPRLQLFLGLSPNILRSSVAQGSRSWRKDRWWSPDDHGQLADQYQISLRNIARPADWTICHRSTCAMETFRLWRCCIWLVGSHAHVGGCGGAHPFVQLGGKSHHPGHCIKTFIYWSVT